MVETVPMRVQHKRMTKAQWQASDVILLEGEIGVETDTGFLKVGDGTNRFSTLKYLTGPQGERGERGLTGATGATGSTGSIGPQGATGERGVSGPKGDKGDSQYVHIAYATITYLAQENSSVTLQAKTLVRFGKGDKWLYKELAAGTHQLNLRLFGEDPAVTITKEIQSIQNFSLTDSTNRTHIGIYNDNVESGSTDASRYTWIRVQGAQGARGERGERGERGQKGDPLRFEDLTPEQINQIRAQNIDLSGYVTKEELGNVPVVYTSALAEKVGYDKIRPNIDYFLDDNGKFGTVTSVGVMRKEVGITELIDPVAYANREHTHVINQITGLTQALAGKQPTGDYVTNAVLNNKGYVTNTTLNSKGYVTETALNGKGYVTQTILNSKNYLTQSTANTTYATKQELRNVQSTPGPKGADGTSINVQVVTAPPTTQAENTLYLVRA
ncbi:hypothetical protein JXA27_09710 [Aerococcaceae bacterium zg-B36]|uniref:hyaluronate lyase N-terminal domain-containing protein n=1 Tax=Aerococcaceae bacterium zg-252 TaxID=2796928 RepID=UPI001BD8A0A2|nr:hypothetical protein [Aerococcaceae bacterium zg-B36]